MGVRPMRGPPDGGSLDADGPTPARSTQVHRWRPPTRICSTGVHSTPAAPDAGPAPAPYSLALGTLLLRSASTTSSPQCWGGNRTASWVTAPRLDRTSPVVVASLGAGVQDIGAGCKARLCDRRRQRVLLGRQHPWTARQRWNDRKRDSRQRGRPDRRSGARARDVSHLRAAHERSSVRCWGFNMRGQLGDGTTVDASTPGHRHGLADATTITAGDAHTCAVRFHWRCRLLGNQLGGPARRRRQRTVGDLRRGDRYRRRRRDRCRARTSAAFAARPVRSHVGDATRRVSSATETVGTERTPVAVVGIGDAERMAAGPGHVCARRVGGVVACWGWNSGGQLGDGTRATARSPVTATAIVDAAALYVGAEHTCVITSAGSAACLGMNVLRRARRRHDAGELRARSRHVHRALRARRTGG